MMNEWNKCFSQSLLGGFLLLAIGFLFPEVQSAEHQIRVGKTSSEEFKQVFPNQAPGDFAKKLKELSEKTSYGKSAKYWRKELQKKFNLTFDIGNTFLHSGYYFVADINHPKLEVIPVLGSKTEMILCLMIYETESKLSTMLVCQDPEHELLVVAEYNGANL